MKKLYLKILLSALVLIGAITGGGIYYTKALASPAFLPNINGCATATATTSPTYLTAGTATSTLDCNAAVATNGASQVWEDSNLLVQFQSSSSVATVFKYRFLYSDDNINWFSDISTSTASNLTSGIFTEYAYSPKASSTETSTINAANAQYSILIPMPAIKARWIRTQFYLATGSQKGAVYAKVIGSVPRIY